jgi:chemotaxis protein methyltransferase WspC
MNLAAVIEVLHRRIGLEAEALGPGVLPKFVAGRMTALGLKDPAAYAARVAESLEEYEILVDEVVVSETWFFRGGRALFAHLAGQVRACAETLGRPCRILSVPCSTGEEPYSLAIALCTLGVPRERFVLEGVDLSRRNLDRASNGWYSPMALREVDQECRRYYFEAVDSGWRIDPAIRALVSFRQGNVMDRLFLGEEKPFDLVFCRNLLIYLHAAARRQVLATLERLLAPGGLLCVGHAEPMLLLDRPFQAVEPTSYFLFRKSETNKPGRVADVAAIPPQPQPRPEPTRPFLPPLAVPTAPVPRTPEPDHLARARRLADEGNLAAALTSCETHLAGAGPSADLFSLLGVIHQARHDSPLAMSYFQRALYLQPDHAEALTHLMLLYQNSGQGAAAELLRRRLSRRSSGGAP